MVTSRRAFCGGMAAAGLAIGSTTAAGGRHVVLLGDSIFDNARYVRPGSPVIEQLGTVLGEGNRATLLANDGDVVADVRKQVQALPADATHLVISVGGNDALGEQDLLRREGVSAAALLADLAAIRSRFQIAYVGMLAAVRAKALPTAVCTIYDSNFDQPKKAIADVALTVFNDAILRCAGDAGVPVIDLRRIFTAPADYANAIEPSVVGGAKMVTVIARVVDKHDFAAARCALYA